MLGRAAEILRQTRKQRDVLWKQYFARPVAAVLLVPLERTRVTPNQLTFASLLLFVVAMALLVFVPGTAGLLAGIGLLQLSYILDCTDGQLARLRAVSTPVGAHLDFLMDELKALLLVVGVSVRLWMKGGDDLWLLEGVVGLAAVATGLTLTTFVRRPEYTGSRDAAAAQTTTTEDQQVAQPRRNPLVLLVETVGRFVIHYPGPIIVFALLDRMDLFLHVYLAVNLAHAGRTLLAVVLRLGRRPLSSGDTDN